MSDPKRYFSCFMGDPAEYWYGQGFIKLISWLRDSGQCRPRNNRFAIISGAKPYSIVIANAMASCAKQFGWIVAYGPSIVPAPITNWNPHLDEVRDVDPAVLANTHFYAGDLARFHLQFIENPIPCLLYLQYGALHRTFRDIVGEKAKGAIVGTVIGLLRDNIGMRFGQRYSRRFGEHSTPEVGGQPYTSLHHYAIAAAIAGGTAGPGSFEQNRQISKHLKDLPYRSVSGSICYHPEWQAAIPYPDAVNDPSLGLPHLFYQIFNSGRPTLGRSWPGSPAIAHRRCQLDQSQHY